MKRTVSTTTGYRSLPGICRFIAPIILLLVASCGGGGGNSTDTPPQSKANIGVNLAIGADDSLAGLARVISDAVFFRSTDFNCNTSMINLCANGEQSTVSGKLLSDDATTIMQPNNYWLKLDGETSHPARIELGSERFSRRQYHRVVEFRNKLWMIGGYDGTANNPGIWSSSDGINWFNEDESNSVSLRYYHDLTVFDDRLWVLGGLYGVPFDSVLSSVDGINWVTEVNQNAAPFSARYLHQLQAFDGKLWLIGGFASAVYYGDVWSSVDGVNWVEETPNAAFGPRSSHQVVVFGDRLWVIGGFDGTNDLNDVWSSVDGINWVEETAAAGFDPRRTSAAIFDGRIWIAGGFANSGPTTFEDVWSSSDGVDWVEETSAAVFGPRQDSQLVAFHDRLHIVAGFNPDNVGVDARLNDILSSADGIEWRDDSSSQPFEPLIQHGLVVHDGKLWLVGGQNPLRPGVFVERGTAEVWYSEDGFTWTRATDQAEFDRRYGHATVSFAGKLWVIGGIDQFQQLVNDVWSSVDGINWTQETPGAGFSVRTQHRVAVFNNMMWLMGGWNNASYYSDVYSSADGITWTPVMTGGDSILARNDHEFYSFGGKLWINGGFNGFVPPGARNELLSSVDGTTWVTEIAQSAAPYSERYGHRVIEHDGKLWLTGGYDGVWTNDVWSSVDGVNWIQETPAAAFAGRNYHAAASFDGLMWVVGGRSPSHDNEVWLSDDGKDWRRAGRTEISFR